MVEPLHCSQPDDYAAGDEMAEKLGLTIDGVRY